MCPFNRLCNFFFGIASLIIVTIIVNHFDDKRICKSVEHEMEKPHLVVNTTKSHFMITRDDEMGTSLKVIYHCKPGENIDRRRHPWLANQLEEFVKFIHNPWGDMEL